MKKITFVEDAAPKDGSGVIYRAGQTYEFNDASANHWLVRNKAVEASSRKRLTKDEPERFTETGTPIPPADNGAEAPGPAGAGQAGDQGGTGATGGAADDAKDAAAAAELEAEQRKVAEAEQREAAARAKKARTLIAQADTQAFMGWKASVRGVLGDDMPNTKAEILAALRTVVGDDKDDE